MKKRVVLILIASLLLLCACQADAPKPGQALQKERAFEFVTVSFDCVLPVQQKRYPTYRVQKSMLTAEDYAKILAACSEGAEWLNVLNKPFSPETQPKGSFKVTRALKDGTGDAVFHGNMNGNRYAMYTGGTYDVTLSETGFESWPEDEPLLQTIKELPSITKEEAEKTANAFKDEAGCYDHYGISRTERALHVDIQTNEVHSDGWLVIYTPQFGGATFGYEVGSVGWIGEPPVSYAPWEPTESLTVYVAEAGIRTVEQKGYSAYSRDKEAAPLSAEKMVDAIENWFGDRFCFEDISENKVVGFIVRKINLRYAVIEGKDAETGIAVPCWEVCFYYQFDYHGEKSESTVQRIVFNAIDGSYIEPYRVRDADSSGSQELG